MAIKRDIQQDFINIAVFGTAAAIIVGICAAWITHVIICIQESSYILLLFGVIVPPIGWIHGIGQWFGLF